MGEFVLDPANECLWRDDDAIALRPKAFALLSYFADNPGRILTKQELLDEVWRDAVVGDSVLKVCVRELRSLAAGSSGVSSCSRWNACAAFGKSPAFFAAMPISITKDTCANILFSKLGLANRATHRKISAPNMANGVPSKIANGNDQLSYCAARIRNTNTNENTSIGPKDPDALFS